MSAEQKTLRLEVADLEPSGARIDSYIAGALGLFTRSQIKRRVVEVRLNGRAARLSRKVHNRDVLEIQYTEAPVPTVEPEAIPLEVLYEDANVVVVNKPQGMVVHPAAGHWSGTLVNALLHHCSTLAERFPAGTPRAGIVHRLDKDTSGVIITARSPEAVEFLAAQFRARRVGKQYLAVVRGRLPQPQGVIETRIGRDPRDRKRFVCLEDPGGAIRAPGGVPRAAKTKPAGAQRAHGANPDGRSRRGKIAVTRYRELRRLDGCSVVSLQPRTGRTHQLRVHMAYLNCPILGDCTYGRQRSQHSLMLHAYRLRLCLPGESRSRTFRAPLPERFRRLFQELGSGAGRGAAGGEGGGGVAGKGSP